MFNDWVDTTNERIRKALETGCDASETDIYLPSGMPSGSKYRKIERPLETALRHKWITSEQKLAGDQFSIYVADTRAQCQFATSRLEVIDAGVRVPNVERRSYSWLALRKATAVLEARTRQPFMNWMVMSEQTDVSIHALGAMFTPLKHKEAQKSLGIYVLGDVLSRLAKHFGYL